MQIRIVCELFSLAAIWQMPHADARHSRWKSEKERAFFGALSGQELGTNAFYY